MTEITLVGLDGNKFKVKFSPLTPARMDLLLRASKNFTDMDLLVQNTLDAIKLMPELTATIPNYEKVKELLDGLKDGKEDAEKRRILGRVLLGGGLSTEQAAENLLAYRNYVRDMCLISGLTDEQIAWIKSGLDSDFWGEQDLENIRSAGQFFRRKVTDFAK